MSNCGNIRYGTGKAFPSSSVMFTGILPEYIPENSVPCDVNLDELLAKMNNKIQIISDSHDYTELEPNCFDFNPLTVKGKELHQLEIDKICDVDDRLGQLIQAVDNLNIGSKIVEIDLGCLKPQAAPCQQGTNKYTLLSILTLFKNEICALKNP